MSTLVEVGANVWLLVDDDWVPCKVVDIRNKEVLFKSVYGKDYAHHQNAVNRQLVTPMHYTSIEGVADMAKLGELHEAAILHNLFLRYKKDTIYTSIGSILVAVNPYKPVSGLYDSHVIQSYKGKHLGDMPPHIYAVANESYFSLWRQGGNQCVLISGESGAGKTESTKHIMRFLSEMSKSATDSSQSTSSVEEAIVQSSPILEAFGNAKTVYNNNSSRFGKFIKLNFLEKGNIGGGQVIDYLLEKNRVVRQNPGERNFHVFYALLAGTSPEQKGDLCLSSPDKYYYLNQSGCISDPTIDDKGDFNSVLTAFRTIGVSTEQIAETVQVLAGILQLGNLSFLSTGGAQVTEKSVLENAANLLQVDSYQLNDCLTQKSMILRGEEILSPLTVEQAVDSRDSMAMALYAATFRWTIKMINKCIKGPEPFHSIGVLDIFGFENFKVNRFEQFNINFANEKLQEYFNKHIFSLEQLEYNREGLEWTDVDWNDNGECLDLVERKLGLLSLFDEESHFPKGTDESLLRKLHENHAENPFYVKPRVQNTKFGIRHYAGEVFYDITGFLQKNRDTFRDDLLNTLRESRSDFIYDLFEDAKPGLETGTRTKARKKPTVSSQFKDSLFSLMGSLNSANPYFVRCVKPNGQKIGDLFEPDLVHSQLKYSGMLETVKIRKAGFPVRRTFVDFNKRYKALAFKDGLGNDEKQRTVSILQKFDNKGEFFRVGRTKVFMKDKIEAELEVEREKRLLAVMQVISLRVYSYIVRKRYLAVRTAILKIQKVYKGHIARLARDRRKKAIVIIQKFQRGYQARKLYHQLLEEKRLEEERRREEERRKAEEARLEMERLEREAREMERLEQEKRMREIEEMKRKQEEEARLKKEEEEAQQKRKEEQRQADLARAKELEEKKRLEEEARRIEEEIRNRELELERMKKEEEEARRIQSEEEERKRKEETERLEREAADIAIAQMKELDEQLKLEEMHELDEDEEFDDDVIPKTTEEGLSDVPVIEGYLLLRGGLMSIQKKHWCVLKDDTLMWFRGKQKALKMGWLTKKGGGTGTLSRRNWKRRWFVLKDTVLSYHETDEDGAKVLGNLDLRNCKQIVDSGQKENAFSIVMADRTYHVVADNPADWNEWYSVLNRVYRANEVELKEMKDDSANIKNAVGTIDTALIESVSSDIATRPNTFNVITANRVYSFTADTIDEAKDWVTAIQTSKEKQLEEGTTIAIERGWLTKAAQGEGVRPKKRWFVLTSNSLDFYKSADKGAHKFGSIALNSLCTVVHPPSPDDPKAKELGQWEVLVNGRKRSYLLSSNSHSDATRWATAIQEVIDSKPIVETPFEKLIGNVMGTNAESMIQRIYRVNPLLCHTNAPLKMPLLPLPYGHCQSSRAKGKGYGTYAEESLRIFTSLQEMETVADPILVIQGILQTCHDMKALRDEAYCQVIKQTTGLETADSLSALRYIQVLVCMCCTFLPSRRILRYLRFHLKRLREKFPDSELSKFSTFGLENLKRTRTREFPPSREEIITLLGRRELNATVYCYGGGNCRITINSSTTAGEVVKTLCKGLGVTSDLCIFGLFEQCGTLEKNIEDRVILADILSKFERYRALGIQEGKGKWRLFFKIFCFLRPENIDYESVEGMFLFEQTVENVVRGKYPLPETTLCKLSALRLQFLEGDFKAGAWIPDEDIAKVYPMSKSTKSNKLEIKGNQKQKQSIKGTIRKAISPFRSGEVEVDDEQIKVNEEEEMSALKSQICDQWKKYQGFTSEEAQDEYMDVVKGWAGFGSSMFDVTTKDPSLPGDLWLGVSYRNVAIYRRGDSRPMISYCYEDILSFGAPQPNKYRIIVSGRDPITFETDMVIEVAKLMKAYINEIVKNARRASQIMRETLH